jgi:Do/DeqQ family serine protease
MRATNFIQQFLAAVFAVTVGAVAVGDSALAAKVLPAGRGEVELSFAPLVKTAAPAVVNIYTRKIVRTRRLAPLFDDPFFRRFFGKKFGYGDGRPRQRIQNSLGSGVIVAADGVIVTNRHVIEGADQITIVLADRREFDATIVGSDDRTDLAVLRIDSGGRPLPFLALRDSDTLEVGDLVLAIGNPFGVGQTVTSGIVSALARTQVGISDLNFFIQTDAAINPGNSGGALVTLDGKLAGINSAIFSKSGGSHGIGFAIPANMVRSVVAGLSEGGRLVRPWLGAWGQPVTAEIAGSLDMARPRGVLVNEIYRGGPADRGGVRVGDIILSVKGQEINNPAGLNFRIATSAIGETIDIAILRRGRERNRSIELVEPPEDPPRDVNQLAGPHPMAGTVVANMSPALGDELGLDRYSPGVIILKVLKRSPAGRFGFRPSDWVRSINGEAIDSVKRLKRVLGRSADRWEITIERGGKDLSMIVNR